MNIFNNNKIIFIKNIIPYFENYIISICYIFIIFIKIFNSKNNFLFI